MHAPILPALISVVLTPVLGAIVELRGDKTRLHRTLITLLGTVAVWNAGTIYRFSLHSEVGLADSVALIFLGAAAVPPLWLLLAGRYAGVRALDQWRPYVALLAPSVLFYVALLTNDAHHLVYRELSVEALEAGGRGWFGPLLWAFDAWCALLGLAALAIYARCAMRATLPAERRRAALLTAAAVLPLASSAVYAFHLSAIPYDLTPYASAIALLMATIALFGSQLVDGLPMARRDVIEHLHDGVVIANARGSILDLNPAAEHILGRAVSQLRGCSLRDVLADRARPAGQLSVRHALEDLENTSQLVATELYTPDNRNVEVSAAWVRGIHGGVTGQFAVLRDRTEERRSERAVRQVQKFESVGTLAAGIAHEVNNPLAFIRANLSQIHRMGERVEAEVDGPNAKLAAELRDLREIAEETLDGIGRIERIVADMRSFSGEAEQSLQSIDMNEVVRDAVRLANLRRESEVEVECRLAPDLPGVEGSQQRLVQALLNLLVNARQALQGVEGGRIEISTRRDVDSVVVRVADNGPGMSEEIQERIFDPFFTTKDPDQGNGLGLAIAFDILRDHGGVLEVRSRVGEGASFVARIPAPLV